MRYVTTRSTFEAISTLPEGDLLRGPLLSWIARLAVSRIGARAFVSAAKARQSPTIRLETPLRGTLSARDLVHRIVADRDDARRRRWLEGLSEAGPALRGAERAVRGAVGEIASRLGASEDLGLPYDRAAVSEAATALLERTDDFATTLLGPYQDVAGLLGRIVAHDVPGAWPTLSGRWLFEQFRATPLLDGLSLDLGPLVPTLGASSFARALARFGAAYARAAVPSGAAFVLAHEPWGAHPLRRGALFASLIADRVFLQKQLGFSREAARRIGRALARTLLVQARLDATRSLADLAEAQASEVHEAIEHALKVRLTEKLASVLPRPVRIAQVRLVGALLAHDDRDLLQNRYDEDWFKNPRALFFLRDTDAALRPSLLPKEALAGAVDRFVGYLEELAS